MRSRDKYRMNVALSFGRLHNLKMQNMNLQLSTKFQPSVTLSSGEGRGEVLKAGLIGSVLMGEIICPTLTSPLTPLQRRGERSISICV